MKTVWIAPALVMMAVGCVQHPPGWNDAWAACEAQAIEQMEFAEVDDDQRSEWRENYIRGCMDRKGFEERSTIWSTWRGARSHGLSQVALARRSGVLLDTVRN
jgi:hypothetical protein